MESSCGANGCSAPEPPSTISVLLGLGGETLHLSDDGGTLGASLLSRAPPPPGSTWSVVNGTEHVEFPTPLSTLKGQTLTAVLVPTTRAFGAYRFETIRGDAAGSEQNFLGSLVALQSSCSEPLSLRANAARIRVPVSYVCGDGRMFYAPLSHGKDVWFAYRGHLHVGGRPMEPLSIWLCANVLRPLQAVIEGEDFTWPTVAASYTQAYLRFELPEAHVYGSTSLEFSADVGQLHPKLRQETRAKFQSPSGAWALSGGVVVRSMWPPEPTLSVRCFVDTFELPGGFEYAVESGEGFVVVSAGAPPRSTLDPADGVLWHRQHDCYTQLCLKASTEGRFDARLAARPIWGP